MCFLAFGSIGRDPEGRGGGGNIRCANGNQRNQLYMSLYTDFFLESKYS